MYLYLRTPLGLCARGLLGGSGTLAIPARPAPAAVRGCRSEVCTWLQECSPGRSSSHGNTRSVVVVQGWRWAGCGNACLPAGHGNSLIFLHVKQDDSLGCQLVGAPTKLTGGPHGKAEGSFPPGQAPENLSSVQMWLWAGCGNACLPAPGNACLPAPGNACLPSLQNWLLTSSWMPSAFWMPLMNHGPVSTGYTYAP